MSNRVPELQLMHDLHRLGEITDTIEQTPIRLLEAEKYQISQCLVRIWNKLQEEQT